ncbi:MAG: ABC transporter ATP-binding protein [Bacillales bacterium]|nr:ABC transporter ATP-binding protein [Bacillales bacterium]
MEITLVGLCKYFVAKDKTVTKAVDNMNLTVPSGKLIALLGPSGCGKSTTLYMIAGLHTPTHGQIFFGDDDVTQVPPEKRGIGLVFQNYALYPHLSVRQNISFPLENERMPKDEINKTVLEMAKLVDIEPYLDRKPNELSGGQQQRVAIARALAKRPKVLLLDEPLSNLDARLRLQTREEIRRIQRETGITTIFVTHDQEEAMSISDEIVVMRQGVIQEIDKPQNVYDNPINLFVAMFLGTPQINVFSGTLHKNKVYIGGNFREKEVVDENNVKSIEYNYEGGNEFYLTDIAIPEGKKAPDKPEKIFVAIRPEGFNAEKLAGNENSEIKQSKEEATKGIIKAKVDLVETIGRDTTLIIEDPTAPKKFFKAIVSADKKIEAGDIVELSVKPHKMYVFNKEGDLI